MQGIKAIKGLVAFMGVLIIVGLAVLGYGLSNTAGKVGQKSMPVATLRGEEFGAVAVPVPAGAQIRETLVVGDKVVLRLGGGGPDRVIVLNPADGRVSGSFILSPEAPAAHQ